MFRVSFCYIYIPSVWGWLTSKLLWENRGLSFLIPFQIFSGRWDSRVPNPLAICPDLVHLCFTKKVIIFVFKDKKSYKEKGLGWRESWGSLVKTVQTQLWNVCSRICLQCRRLRFDPWSGRSPGEGSGSPLQYSCLGNPMDRGAWWAIVHGVAKNRT